MRPPDIRRDASKAARSFHARWVQFLTQATPRTLRRVAHELAALEAENALYQDGKIFRVLREELELTIQQAGGSRCSWTVARSNHDLRGKTRSKRSKIHVSREVKADLGRKLSLLDDQDEL